MNQSPITVLVVDDWPDSAEAMAMMLALSGFKTLIAHDGEEAVRLFAEHSPDIAIIDLLMPRLNGIEVAKRVCADNSRARPLLIARSGFSTAEQMRAAHSAGFDHFLIKPVDPTRLVGILHDHARKLRQQAIAAISVNASNSV